MNWDQEGQVPRIALGRAFGNGLDEGIAKLSFDHPRSPIQVKSIGTAAKGAHESCSDLRPATK